MQAAMHLKTTVLPDGKIELTDLKLPVGKLVDIFVIFPDSPDITTTPRSAIDILSEAPGKRLFKTAEEVDAYIKEERESWEN